MSMYVKNVTIAPGLPYVLSTCHMMQILARHQ